VTITGVQTISETSFTPPIWYGAPVARDAGGAPTPIIPGMSEVQISVSVTYLIG
jgi:uncharacterized protein YggE